MKKKLMFQNVPNHQPDHYRIVVWGPSSKVPIHWFNHWFGGPINPIHWLIYWWTL